MANQLPLYEGCSGSVKAARPARGLHVAGHLCFLATVLVRMCCGCGDRKQPTGAGTEQNTLQFANSPVASPDGRFVYFDLLKSNGAGIVRYDLRNSNCVALTSGGTMDMSPVISADGTMLAFARQNQEGQHIWIMDTNGQHQIQVTHGTVIDVLGASQKMEPTFTFFARDSKGSVYCRGENFTNAVSNLSANLTIWATVSQCRLTGGSG